MEKSYLELQTLWAHQGQLERRFITVGYNYGCAYYEAAQKETETLTSFLFLSGEVPAIIFLFKEGGN